MEGLWGLFLVSGRVLVETLRPRAEAG